MKTIFKYPLDFTDYQTIEIPMNGVIVDIEYQEDDIFAWVMFNHDIINHKEQRSISICGTGHPVNPMTPDYIKSLHKDGFVWHFFEGYNV